MKKLLYFLPVFLLAACGKQNSATTAGGGTSTIQDAPVQMEDTGEPDPIAVEGAKRGGTFSTWDGPFPKSLNAWLDNNAFAVQVSALMFEPLIDLQSTKDEPVGILAQSWEISPDKKTYTFHLDPNAKWSDGKPVTAEDVQFFYDVIMNPKNLTSLYRVDLVRFARPEVLDEHTVRITANEPHWKNFWAAGAFVAFPKHVWKDVDFNQQNFSFPAVTGPYALDEVKMDRSVKLKRRGDWWGRARKYNLNKYNFDYIVFKAMEDRTKALEVLKKGEFDEYAIYTAKLWAVDTIDIPQVQKNWIVRQVIYNDQPKSFQGLALNMRRPILSDLKVRQALAYLLDRQTMNNKLMFNQYFLLNSYFPQLYPNNVNPDVPVVQYDPDKARQLLKEAGWQVGPDGILVKDGQQFTLNILHYEGSELRHLNIYIEDMKAVGIKAGIELVSMSTFTKRVDNHDFDMIWANFDAVRLNDPEQMWSSKEADEIASQNYSGVKDPEIDKLIEAQKTEMDALKRDEIDKQIDARLMEICPYVLMWQAGDVRLLYWNKFGTPKYVLSKYDNEQQAAVYWWYDPDKGKALEDAQKNNTALPALPAEVHYQE